jgi:hypothetical protein
MKNNYIFRIPLFFKSYILKNNYFSESNNNKHIPIDFMITDGTTHLLISTLDLKETKCADKGYAEPLREQIFKNQKNRFLFCFYLSKW